MKWFWIILAAGVGLVALSSLTSMLGAAASQRSDFGVIAASVLGIVMVAAAVPITLHFIKKAQGTSETKEKP